ncbi:MAG TPA: Rho termination factor N-terminal domain-containing protein [Bacillota bacterium]|nr:Rho termination factor N-terminal domain-containing protein [Bacillota bacterium]
MADAVIEASGGQSNLDVEAEEDTTTEETDIEEVLEEEVVANKKPAPVAKPVVVKVTSQPVKEEVKPVEKAETKVVEIDLDSKTVAELKDMAKELNLSGYSSLRKADLIDLIRTAL